FAWRLCQWHLDKHGLDELYAAVVLFMCPPKWAGLRRRRRVWQWESESGDLRSTGKYVDGNSCGDQPAQSGQQVPEYWPGARVHRFGIEDFAQWQCAVGAHRPENGQWHTHL